MFFCDNKTVTLFNRSHNAQTEREMYYPTLLEGVDLVESKGVHVSDDGKDSADTAKLYVSFSVLETKPYIEPKTWAALSEEEKHNYITFTPAEDFFMKGDHTDLELPESNAQDLITGKFDGVYKVTDVNKYEDILPHFEIGGV